MGRALPGSVATRSTLSHSDGLQGYSTGDPTSNCVEPYGIGIFVCSTPSLTFRGE
jgi:hypothetical protein